MPLEQNTCVRFGIASLYVCAMIFCLIQPCYLYFLKLFAHDLRKWLWWFVSKYLFIAPLSNRIMLQVYMARVNFVTAPFQSWKLIVRSQKRYAWTQYQPQQYCFPSILHIFEFVHNENMRQTNFLRKNRVEGCKSPRNVLKSIFLFRKVIFHTESMHSFSVGNQFLSLMPICQEVK